LQGLLSQLETGTRNGDGPTWKLAELRDARDLTVNLLARARMALKILGLAFRHDRRGAVSTLADAQARSCCCTPAATR
jgi:hypothetical protein